MLLALDTSTRVAGVALYDGVQVLAEVTWNSRDYHTRELAPIVHEVMERAEVKMSMLQVVAVATGPGSFTGLRIGLALAKGIAFGRRIPLVGVPTLDYLAAAQPLMEKRLIAVLKAGRGRLAVGYYHAQDGIWVMDGKPMILDVEALSRRITRPTLVCGELNEEERRILARKRKNVLLSSPAQSSRRPGFLAELAWQRWLAGEVDNPATLTPLYVHIGEPIPG